MANLIKLKQISGGLQLQSDITSVKNDITTIQSSISSISTGALHYKGTIDTIASLASHLIDDEPYVPTIGDVWNISTTGEVDADGTPIKAGDNVIYNGTGWDVSAGTVDLSGYYTKSETNGAIDTAKSAIVGSEDDGASANTIHGVKAYSDSVANSVVNNLDYTDDTDVSGKYVSSVSESQGVISVTHEKFPVASSTDIGMVSIGTGLGINDDGKLYVTGDATVNSVEWSVVQNTPTSISGYRITDAYTKDEIDAKVGTLVDDEGHTVSIKDYIDNSVGTIEGEDGSTVSVKDYVDSSVSSLQTDITSLETTIGNASDDTNEATGLYKLIEDNAKAIAETPVYSVARSSEDGNYAAVYQLTKDGVAVGTSINIPKDMVVKEGSVVTNPDNQEAGTYLKLVLSNATNDEIFINVGSLIEYVTSGSNTGDMVVVSVNDEHKVTATITDGTVTKAKLDSTVQASLGKADSAVQSITVLGSVLANGDSLTVDAAKAALGLDSAAYTKSSDYATAVQGALADSAVQSITTGSTNGTISVDGTDVAVKGLDSAAYASVNAFDAAGSANTALTDAKAYANELNEKVVVRSIAYSDCNAVTSNEVEGFSFNLAPDTGYSFVSGYAKVYVNTVAHHYQINAGSSSITVNLYVGYSLDSTDEIFVEFLEKLTPVV